MNVPFVAHDAQQLMLAAHERGPREFTPGCFEHLLEGWLVGIQMAADCGLEEYVLYTPFSADKGCEIQSRITDKFESAHFSVVCSVYCSGGHRLLRFNVRWASM